MVINQRAVFFMLLSTLSLSLSGLFTKVLTEQMSGGLLTFLRLATPAIILFFAVAIAHFPKLERTVIGSIIIRALCIIACQFFFIKSMQSLSLVESVVLFATGPLFIPLLEKLLFNVTIKPNTLIGLVITFIGVIMMAGNLTGMSFRHEYLYGLAAGLFNAGSQVSLFRASQHNISPASLNFWTFSLAALGALPLLLWQGASVKDIYLLTSPGQLYWVWLIMAAFSMTIVANQIFRARAYKLVASNSELAPLIYTNILFSVAWQYLFFNVSYSYNQLIGIALILIASLINTFSFSITKPVVVKMAEKH